VAADPKWLTLNATFASSWPNITRKKPAPADAEAWDRVPNKLAEHFSDRPGSGDVEAVGEEIAS
jgi:ferredoxin